MANRIQLRRDTADNWNRVNPILDDGEPGLDLTTNKIKYGDGNTAWRDLAYASGSGSGDRLTKDSYNLILDGSGSLTLPTEGHIGPTKGGTMLDGGNGYNASLTSFYSSGLYSSCVTANPGGTLNITAYNDGGPDPAKIWTFDNDGALTFPQGTSLGTADGSGAFIIDGVGDKDILIYTYGSSTAHGWIFDQYGNLTIPGEIKSTAGIGPVAVQSNDGNNTYNWNFGTDGILTLPPTVGGGNEGAEIDFTKAPNSTLSGSIVVVDQYADRIRFFEGGGTARGAYIDLKQAAAGVGTLLNNRVSAFVNAGTFVTMDNIKATVTTSGNRGLSLATVSGTATCYISGTYGMYGGATVGGNSAGVTLTTTPSVSIFDWSFGSEGDTATYILNDSYSRSYRITMMVGGAYSNNMISIERLI